MYHHLVALAGDNAALRLARADLAGTALDQGVILAADLQKGISLWAIRGLYCARARVGAQEVCARKARWHVHGRELLHPAAAFGRVVVAEGDDKS